MSESSQAEVLTEDEIKAQIFNFMRDNFKNPAELLAWIDDDLQNGVYKLHNWQAKIHVKEFGKSYTSQDPLDLNIRAVNGSGKDEKVITPAALFLIVTNKAARVVITSASGRQLETQTEVYLARFAAAINRKLTKLFNLGEKVVEFLIIKKRSIVCIFAEDSEILLFATDEPGKAEGYHPIKAGAVFAMIMNECKSIDEKMWGAFFRCNGFTHWIEVSSPGPADGHFYNRCVSIRMKTTSNGEVPAIVNYVITSDDCPHLGGENYKARVLEEFHSTEHHQYKSMVTCEFGSDDIMVVIGFDKYNRLIKFQNTCEHLNSEDNIGGLDLAFGGDEIVLKIRNGNKHIGTEKLKSKETTIICKTIKEWFIKWNLMQSTVWVDAGGLGDVIISLLRSDYGCKNLHRIKNNWAASNTAAYANLGTEMWFQFAKLIEAQEIIIKDEDVLRKQLCNRYYKINSDNSAQLESKQQAKSKGRSSPDRADALVLCFHNYKTPQAIKKKVELLKKLNQVQRSKKAFVPSIQNLIHKNRQLLQQQVYMRDNGMSVALGKSSLSKSVRNELQREMMQNLRIALCE